MKKLFGIAPKPPVARRVPSGCTSRELIRALREIWPSCACTTSASSLTLRTADLSPESARMLVKALGCARGVDLDDDAVALAVGCSAVSMGSGGVVAIGSGEVALALIACTSLTPARFLAPCVLANRCKLRSVCSFANSV